MERKANEISERMLENGADIVRLCNTLHRNFTFRHIARQLLRSGTACGANYEEARGAQSRADFLHKLQIVLKELRETVYWLRLVLKVGDCPENEIQNTLKTTVHLSNIIAKSIKTAKNNKK